MTSSNQTPDDDRKLVRNLTIADARRLLSNEGGELTATELAARLVSIAVVSALLARAIWLGGATAWHMALPMVAQYLALLAAMPVVYLALRHPDLRKDSVNALRVWIGAAAVAAIAIAVRSRLHAASCREQAFHDAAQVWNWIAGAEMQWPMLLAAIGVLAALPARVRNLYEFGPPFMGVGLGCAMQIVMLFVGCFLLPFAMGSTMGLTWFLWAALLAADLLAVWMHWDMQRRLREVDVTSSRDDR